MAFFSSHFRLPWLHPHFSDALEGCAGSEGDEERDWSFCLIHDPFNSDPSPFCSPLPAFLVAHCGAGAEGRHCFCPGQTALAAGLCLSLAGILHKSFLPDRLPDTGPGSDTWLQGGSGHEAS